MEIFSLFSYNTIKTWIQGGNSRKPLGPSMHMFAAADAGILTLVMTNPLWVVKTRLCLQYMDDKHLPETLRYNGMIDAIKKIYRTEGVRGLYRVSESLFGERKKKKNGILNLNLIVFINIYRVLYLECLASHMVLFNLWCTKN